MRDTYSIERTASILPCSSDVHAVHDYLDSILHARNFAVLLLMTL